MDVNVVGVIGAGQMGRGIAQVAARAGLTVRLLDVDIEAATAARALIERDLQRSVAAQRISAADRDQALQRIHVAGAFEELGDVDCAIEAVPEDADLKVQVLGALDRVLPAHALVASNTSSISLTRLAAATGRPEQVIGIHFMNPAPVMQLVEIVRGLRTSDEVYATACALAERLGKTVVTSADTPGFIVNRMLIPFLNEACFALQEGVASLDDIDRAARFGLNHPLGPFELADLIGLDTVLAIAEVLHRELGDDKYRPPHMLRAYVAAGWLGRKTGRGFHSYA